MLSSSILASALLFIAGAQAHASIVFPPPFDAKTNSDINSPISAAKFPCSGLHKSGGPSAATLTAGAESKITFKGSAIHGGGSCQVGLSYDKTNFYVMHSWQGGCPIADGGSLSYTVPSDAPAGDAVFAWTWINKVGNREFYMNCGAVTIVAGTGAAPAVPFLSRPDLFVANLGNGCSTPDSTDTTYPDPGPDVTGAGAGNPLTGCQPVNGVGNAVRGGGGALLPALPSPNPSASSTPVASTGFTTVTKFTTLPLTSSSTASQLPTSSTKSGRNPSLTSSYPLFTSSPVLSVPTTLQSGIPSELSTFIETPSSVAGNPSSAIVTPPSTNTNTVPAAPSNTDAPPPTPGGGEGGAGLEESTDGTCSGTKKCRAGFCCSAAGFCGNSALHCGAGCQAGFGKCGSASRRSEYLNGHRRRFHGGGRVRV